MASETAKRIWKAWLDAKVGDHMLDLIDRELAAELRVVEAAKALYRFRERHGGFLKIPAIEVDLMDAVRALPQPAPPEPKRGCPLSLCGGTGIVRYEPDSVALCPHVWNALEARQ